MKLSMLERQPMCGQLVGCAAAVALLFPGATAARAEGWAIRSVAQPTAFSAKDVTDMTWELTVDATGGTYELGVKGATTEPIAWDAGAATIQGELERLVTVGAGNVVVTEGQATGTTHKYEIRFTGTLSGTGQPGTLEVPTAGEKLVGGSKTIVKTVLSFAGSRDRYTLVADNDSAKATQPGQAIVIRDELPAGLNVLGIVGEDLTTKHGLSCVISPLVECADSEPVQPADVLIVGIKVAPTTTTETMVRNTATIEGGGDGFSSTTTGPPATTANMVNGATAAFGVQDFGLNVFSRTGALDDQAGDHPDSVLASFDFTTAPLARETPTPEVNLQTEYFHPTEEVKDIVVYLPIGLSGDALAVPPCPQSRSDTGSCQPEAQIGVQAVSLGGPYSASSKPIINLVPESGYPAEFSSPFVSAVDTYPSVVKTPQGYRVRVSLPGIPRSPGSIPLGATVTYFGNPAERDHTSNRQFAFFRNPTSCSEPAGALSAHMEVDSWQKPGEWKSSPEDPVVYNGIEGCDMLQFNPEMTVTPETSQVDSPSGYEIDLKAPQSLNEFPVLATPDLKNATVTLPAGVSLSPSAANGLVGCPASGPEGIDIPSGVNPATGQPLHANEAGEGEEIGPDGLSHLAPGHCPSRSEVGEVEIETPLLARPLKGHAYVAQPQCGGQAQGACQPGDEGNGRLYGIYLEASGSGVVIKLRGNVSVNPVTGRVTTTFTENPQLPFEELRLKLRPGAQAPLANPQTCGTARTASTLEPWGGPSAAPSSEFLVTGCSGPMPFAPSFQAGALQTLGGDFTPFTTTLSRRDGEQDLAGVSVTLPPGLEGMISRVALCGEPDANAGACPEASRIGVAHVAAGAGSQPLWLEGRVYLTAPYHGAPFGLSIVVPARGGPFNLGDEVVRAAISVDRRTAQVSIVSNPIPLIRFGVPFRIKTLNVTVDRSGFILDPTNCAQLRVTGFVSGQLPDGSPGSSVPVSTPFAAAGCRNLPFKPSLSAVTLARTSRARGASLHVIVKSGLGQANIKSVHVLLPKRLPSRLSTLNHACPESQFAANPAGCPARSVVGTAVARTPLLPVPLRGPAYFVSHGGAGFPDLVVVLQGDGVVIELTGKTLINKGVTSSTFRSLPEVPVSRFDLMLPQGPNSALAGRHLCQGRLIMPTSIVGANGARLQRNVVIAVSGCHGRRAAKTPGPERPRHHTARPGKRR